MNRQDFIEHVIGSGCKLYSNSPRFEIYVNLIDKKSKSAIIKNEELTPRYICDVCRYLNVSVPVAIQIINPGEEQ